MTQLRTSLEAGKSEMANPKFRDGTVDFDNLEAASQAEELNEAADRLPLRTLSPFGLSFNPVASFIGFSILWGLGAFCMYDPALSKELLVKLQADCSATFAWLFIGAKPVTLLFMLYVGWRFGDQKLGHQDDEPEFSDATYFAMLFNAGVAVGMFFYGVTETIFHADPAAGNRFVNAGFHTQDEIDTYALNLTIYHWGLAGWGSYAFLGILMGIMSYREGLPMSIRSCFFPILGEHTWGWIGDVIDGTAIVCVVAGVCTSLGLGAQSMVAGTERVGIIDLGDDADTDARRQTANIIMIGIVTVLATISVVSGLNYGIKILSQTAFVLGVVIWLGVFFVDDWSYTLNVLLNAVGYHFQWFFHINFETDAFAQLEETQGRDFINLPGETDQSAGSSWLSDWSVFYQSWWTSASTFVGLFIARISKGRTIRNVLIFNLAAPFTYVVLWFGMFGGLGLRSVRRANDLIRLGKAAFNDSEYFSTGKSTCYDPVRAAEELTNHPVYNYTLPNAGITQFCTFDPNAVYVDGWYNLITSYKDIGMALTVLTLFSKFVYFVTSSDSGSLIVDHLASNGHEKHHWAQRVFWALTEGALAAVLLWVGDRQALQAVQAATVVAGLPFTVLMLLLLSSLYRVCRRFEIEQDPNQISVEYNTFQMNVWGGVLDCIEWALSLGHIPEGRGAEAPTMATLMRFLKCLFFPPLVFMSVHARLYRNDANRRISERLVSTVLLSVCFYGSLLFLVLASVNPGMLVPSQVAYTLFAVLLTMTRSHARSRLNIDGNLVEDFLSCATLFPNVLAQLDLELEGYAPAAQVDISDEES